MGILNTYPQIAGLHATTHEPGGEDVIVGVAPGAHEITHIQGGADDIDSALDSRALGLVNQGDITFRAAAANTLATLGPGAAGTALLSQGAGADLIWGAPTPAAHVLATTGPHSAPLPLTDLEVGVQGNIITRTGADWVAFAVGGAGDALLSGGGGADVSWGAPAPAVHATTHESGGTDEVRNMELNTALANLAYSGLVSIVTAGEIVVAGDTLFLQNDGEYYKSDADAAATMPIKVIAVADAAAHATVLVLHEGYYRNDALYNWTPGAGAANLLFADVNLGALVQLAGQPAGAGDQVQVCGWIVNADQIYFRPSLVLAELVP